MSSKKQAGQELHPAEGEKEPMQVERNHICKVFYLCAKRLLECCFFFLLLLRNHEGINGIILFFLVLGILLCIVLFSVLDWRKQVFYFYEEAIYYKSGLLNVKIKEIPLKRVTTVDLTQGILDKIFGTVRVKVDTGNLSKTESEISLLVSEKKGFALRSRILKVENNSKKERKPSNNVYKISMKQLLLYACSSNAIAKGIGIIFAAYIFFDNYILDFWDIKPPELGEIEVNSPLVVVLCIAFVVILVSLFLSIVSSLIQYYAFQAELEGDRLNIRYGLLNEKHYSFPRDKIKGIHAKQNMLMQILHVKTLEIESIGYGDEKGESAILFPICNEKLEKEIVDNLLPEFIFQGDLNTPPKRALGRFLWKKLFFSGIVIAILAKYTSFAAVGLLLLPFACLLGYMQFRNAAVGVQENLILMRYNGIYKTKSVMKKTAVQSFKRSYSYFQGKHRLADFEIGVFSNEKYKNLTVKNLDSGLVNEYLKKAR